jgi:F-type H+-transporting ATPase subunit b
MGEILSNLGISWPKLIAQTVNFGIVLFVLWKFAYKPILDLLEQRRKKIKESVNNADKIKAELAETEQARKDVLEKANDQAGKLTEEGREAAEKVREAETQKAIKEAEQIITKAREASQADHARMLTELRQEVGKLVVATTGKVIGKTLTDQDQQRLVEETNAELAS